MLANLDGENTDRVEYSYSKGEAAKSVIVVSNSEEELGGLGKTMRRCLFTQAAVNNYARCHTARSRLLISYQKRNFFPFACVCVRVWRPWKLLLNHYVMDSFV